MKHSEIAQRLTHFEDEIARIQLCARILRDHGEKLSSGINISPQSMIWIYTYEREDLQALLSLAQFWAKSKDGEETIDYSAKVDGQQVTIKARGDALPPTCKMVEEEYEIPEQPAVPARKATRMKLVCADRVTAESELAPVDPPSPADPEVTVVTVVTDSQDHPATARISDDDGANNSEERDPT